MKTLFVKSRRTKDKYLANHVNLLLFVFKKMYLCVISYM